jgi:hypothetical protein
LNVEKITFSFKIPLNTKISKLIFRRFSKYFKLLNKTLYLDFSRSVEIFRKINSKWSNQLIRTFKKAIIIIFELNRSTLNGSLKTSKQ